MKHRPLHIMALLIVGSILVSLALASCNQSPAEEDEFVNGESRFGVCLATDDYALFVSQIRELGEQLHVRGVLFNDAYRWLIVKNDQQDIEHCNSCCDPTRSACKCKPRDLYYCNPESRDSLLDVPTITDTEFNLLADLYASRYDELPPKELTADYPHGNEEMYRDYVSFLVENFGERIKLWVIGNENDAPGFWAGTPAEYADLLVIAAEIIREHCADCKVAISFARPGISHKAPELREEWFQVIGNVCSSFDVIDAHFYDSSFIEAGELDRWKELCPGKEFISSETGVPDYQDSKTQNAGGSLEQSAVYVPSRL